MWRKYYIAEFEPSWQLAKRFSINSTVCQMVSVCVLTSLSCPLKLTEPNPDHERSVGVLRPLASVTFDLEWVLYGQIDRLYCDCTNDVWKFCAIKCENWYQIVIKQTKTRQNTKSYWFCDGQRLLKKKLMQRIKGIQRGHNSVDILDSVRIVLYKFNWQFIGNNYIIALTCMIDVKS